MTTKIKRQALVKMLLTLLKTENISCFGFGELSKAPDRNFTSWLLILSLSDQQSTVNVVFVINTKVCLHSRINM